MSIHGRRSITAKFSACLASTKMIFFHFIFNWWRLTDWDWWRLIETDWFIHSSDQDRISTSISAAFVYLLIKHHSCQNELLYFLLPWWMRYRRSSVRSYTKEKRNIGELWPAVITAAFMGFLTGLIEWSNSIQSTNPSPASDLTLVF